MEFIRTENIVKTYANHKALDNVNITVPEGKIYGLLGPNGAGKTSLIRIINMITAPDSGTVYFGDEKLSAKHIINIGYLPEERGLYKKMKIGEQALYLAQLKGMNRQEALKKLKYWFEKFEIQTWWDKKVEELSKGMQQKVQFIVTVLHEPRLLIFDEPFSGFDPINANLLKQEILEMKRKGSTIIFSTHNMSSVEEVCDNIALINNSKNILEGPIDEIKEKYKSNIFEVTFQNRFNKMEASLSANYKILDYEQTGDIHKTKIELFDGFTPNQLIENLLPLGDINSFNEIIPNMNDIFIKVVNDENSMKENQTEK